MKMHAFRLLLALAVALPVGRAQETFDAFADRAAEEWVRQDPQLATGSQYFTGAEQDALDRQLVAFWPYAGLPLDPTLRATSLAHARRLLAELRRFDRAGMTPSQRNSADAIESTLQQHLTTEAVMDQFFIFQQMGGLHVSLVSFLTQQHPMRRPRDIENYLARLALVDPAMDLGIKETRAQASRGILPPKFILNAVLGQFDRFLQPEPAQNVFVTSLAGRSSTLAGISSEQRAAWIAQAETIVAEKIRPAFRRARALVAEQLPRATDDAGIWRLPRGAMAYQFALDAMTTTSMTADEIHALGLREVTRIESEMDRLLGELGERAGSVGERYARVNARRLPAAQPDPRTDLIAEFTRIIRDAERRAETMFDLRPKAPVEVRREPIVTEQTAAAHYSEPAPDGSQPGIFWAPLPEPLTSMWLGAAMRTVTYHEAVPGHHFQLALQQELPELPRFRRFGIFGASAAYNEGWALYAERLATEAGWYEGDAVSRLGQLNMELFRARRLVVDTGLHAKRWTRQQAIDYGIDVAEVERYVVWPGQACSYKIGELEILRLRAKAQAALGPKFSMTQFHNAVLRVGSVRLTVLARAIDEYIVSAK